MEHSWRRELPVLVTEAGSMGAIGVIRSLGRAGYPVHAVAQSPEALGLRSRYCRAAVVCPEYHRPEFLDWLGRYVREHGIRAIIPSEAFLLTVRPAFSDYSPLLPFPSDEETLYRGLSKADVCRTLEGAGGDVAAHLPPSLYLDESGGEVSDSALAALGYPLFLKVDGSHSLSREPGKVFKADTAAEARGALGALRGRYSRVLIQGHVPGRGAGVFFLMWGGEVLAEFQHRRLHEVPHTGGVSSFRESHDHGAVRDDALRKLRALNWRGVGMMEYRIDETTGGFHFIEFNGRFWGSLHLALFAGVDFPTLLVDAFHGRPRHASEYRPGVRCRNTFPEEVQYVWSRLKDRRLGRGSRAWSLLEFALLSLDPRVHNDLLYPGDRRLWVIATGRSLAPIVSGLAHRLGLKRSSDG